MPPAPPDFVIIGAQKAGSTALMRRLGAHPEVLLPFGETRYFRDPWYGFQSPDVLADAVATDDPDVRIRGIKCPDLLGTAGSAERVRAALPDARLLAVLREPVARAVSAYFWYMQWGLVPVEHPDTGLARLLDGKTDSPRSWEILEFGRYGAHLPEWVDAFGRDQLFVVLDDDLRANEEGTLRRALEFLGADPQRATAGTGQQDNSGVYSLTRLRFLQRRVRLLLRDYPGWDGTYLQPPDNRRAWLADRVIAAADRIVLARVIGNERPALSPHIARRLADHYRDDITATEQVLGRDLEHWRAPVGTTR